MKEIRLKMKVEFYFKETIFTEYYSEYDYSHRLRSRYLYSTTSIYR